MNTQPSDTPSAVVLLSVTQAAKRLTISRRQYYRLLQRGQVPKLVNLFGVVRVPQHEIDAIISAKLAARI